MNDNIQEIYLDRIDDPELPMRTDLDRNALFELADNIKQNGLINPITVRPKGGRFEVVAGHRRFSACKLNGMLKIKCVVRDLTDEKALEVMAAENLERNDVDPVDESIFIQRMMEHTNKSVQEIAKSIRRSVAYVESRLAVADMPAYMRDYLKRGDIKLGVALALAKIDDDDQRRHWVDLAVRDGISVATANYWLYQWESQKLPVGAAPAEPPDMIGVERPHQVMFECAIDGQKYDAKLFRTVMVYEGNLSLLDEFVRLYRSSPSSPPSPAGEFA